MNKYYHRPRTHALPIHHLRTQTVPKHPVNVILTLVWHSACVRVEYERRRERRMPQHVAIGMM